MCLTIFLEMMYSCFLYGGRYKSSGLGVSVANANDANESMIRLTQRSWIAASGLFWKAKEPMRHEKRATTLTDSWNWRKRLMLSNTFLPQLHALTIEAKLSS